MNTLVAKNETVTTPVPTITVMPKRQISTVVVNRLIRDALSKVEMVARDIRVEGSISSTYSKSRRGVSTISIALDYSVRDNLENYYTNQIIDNDNSLKDIRDQIALLETQYKSVQTSYDVLSLPNSNLFSNLYTYSILE